MTFDPSDWRVYCQQSRIRGLVQTKMDVMGRLLTSDLCLRYRRFSFLKRNKNISELNVEQGVICVAAEDDESSAPIYILEAEL